MSKEKQTIEEMAKDVTYSIVWDSDGYATVDCLATAKKLHLKGYRKQSEGEWLGDADGYADGEFVYDVWHCSECNHCIDDGTDDAELLPNYCPNCGAKMKGGE